MPYNYDFSVLENIKTVEVFPAGWISNLSIEYGAGERGWVPHIFWRVKGTEHTFVIPTASMEFLSSGNYQKHFNETLETFRENYIEWYSSGFEIDWQQEYRDQFSRFISI